MMHGIYNVKQKIVLNLTDVKRKSFGLVCHVFIGSKTQSLTCAVVYNTCDTQGICQVNEHVDAYYFVYVMSVRIVPDPYPVYNEADIK
jgi:hypothetical protein